MAGNTPNVPNIKCPAAPVQALNRATADVDACIPTLKEFQTDMLIRIDEFTYVGLPSGEGYWDGIVE